jgi:hypothetical protein
MSREVAPVLIIGCSTSALDLAFLSHFFGGLLGLYHGARILEAKGLFVTILGEIIVEVASTLGQIIKHDAKVTASDDDSQPESSLKKFCRACRTNLTTSSGNT